MTAKLAQVSLTTSSISTINPDIEEVDQESAENEAGQVVDPGQGSAPDESADADKLAQLQRDLQTLEAELQSTQRLINERATRSYALQVAQTGVLLGSKSQVDLEEAHRQLEESIAAVSRKSLLEQAIADQRRAIEEHQFADRRKLVDSIRREFQDVMARYTVESKKLLEIHRHLVSLDLKYRSVARGNDGLLDAFYLEVNLPAATGSLASRSGYCTGQDC